jgi:hypothetical protein
LITSHIPAKRFQTAAASRPAIFNRFAAKGPQVCCWSLGKGRKEARKKLRNYLISAFGIITNMNTFFFFKFGNPLSKLFLEIAQ